MDFRRSLIVITLASALILAACAEPDGNVQIPATEAMIEHTPETVADELTEEAAVEITTEEAMVEEIAEVVKGEEPAESAMQTAPAWFTISLTDVKSGQSFTIADYKGKVILLENMAIWCSTCLRQQNQVLELHNQLGEMEDLVSIGLDIDANEDAGMLRQYIESKGFDWTYAVAPVEMSREIGNLYGAQFLNPPSAPMLIIDREGNVHPLPFGVKSAEDLAKALEPFMDDGV